MPLSTTAPLLSIVMPCFNQVEFIESSLLSIIEQDYPNLEIIVIDGGSTDGTVEVIRRYESHITYWVSERDRGQSHALNKGFERASGEIFGWMNSDDLYCPGAFQSATACLEANPTHVAVYSDRVIFDDEDRVLKIEAALPPWHLQLVYDRPYFENQACFWRRLAHDECGPFDEGLHYSMDLDFFSKMILRFSDNQFKKLDSPLGMFRLQDDQKTVGENRHKLISEIREIRQRLDLPLFDRRWDGAIRILFLMRRAYYYLRAAGPREVLAAIGRERSARKALRGLEY